MKIDIPSINVKEFLKKGIETPIIDVRSPAEFTQAHIPGAVNLPLFSNEERATVGTIYKKKNKEKAVLAGLDIVGPKMAGFVVKAKKISKDNKILIHCWRGGMRSGSMAWLFQTAGLNVEILEDGYKAYRQFIKNEFTNNANILILSGSTGSGKTDVLKELYKLDEQIIDLEGIAHHKGSAFGSIGEKKQNSTEQFENNLYKAWAKLDLKKRIWVEDESKAIGANHIPDEVFVQMRAAAVIKINVPKEVRIKRLVKDYTYVDKEILIYHLNRIQKRLGPNETKIAIESVQNGDMTYAVDLSLTYYDKAYNHGLLKRELKTVSELNLTEDNPLETAKKLILFM